VQNFRSLEISYEELLYFIKKTNLITENRVKTPA